MNSQGPSIVACMSVMSSSFTYSLIPSGGLEESSIISLDIRRMTCGGRFSTLELDV